MEGGLHWVWLGGEPKGKDGIDKVYKTIYYFIKGNTIANKTFNEFSIHTDNPDNIKNAIKKYINYIEDRIDNYKKCQNECSEKNWPKLSLLEFENYKIDNYNDRLCIEDFKEQKEIIDEIKKRKIKINIIDIAETIKEDDFSKLPFIKGILHKYQIQIPPLYAGISDIYRLMILAKKGGMYLDFDANPKKLSGYDHKEDISCHEFSHYDDANLNYLALAKNNIKDDSGIEKPYIVSGGNFFILAVTERAKKMLAGMEEGIRLDMAKGSLNTTKNRYNVETSRNEFKSLLELTGPLSKAYSCEILRIYEDNFDFDSANGVASLLLHKPSKRAYTDEPIKEFRHMASFTKAQRNKRIFPHNECPF